LEDGYLFCYFKKSKYIKKPHTAGNGYATKQIGKKNVLLLSQSKI